MSIKKPSAVDSPYVTIDTTPTRLASKPVAGGGVNTVAADVAPTVSANADANTNASSTGSNVSYYTSGIEGVAGLASYGRVFAGANVYVTLEQPQYITYNQNYTGSGTVGGANGQIQFNDNGLFAGSANLTFDGANLTVGGKITGSQVSTTGSIVGGNVFTAGQVSATGNVTGNYFIGNGSQLTGINAGSSNKIFNGNSYANIANASGNLVINANGNIWSFNTNGNLTFPDNSGCSWPIQEQRFGMGNIGAWLDGQWTIGEFSGNGVSGQVGIRIDPGIEGNTGITIPSQAGSTTQRVSIYNTGGGGIELYTGANNWEFNADGTTLFPNSTINPGNGISLTTRTQSSGNAYAIAYQTSNSWEAFAEDDATGAHAAYAWIKADLNTVETPRVFITNAKGSDGTELTWTFDADGNLNFPNDANIAVIGNVTQFNTGANGFLSLNSYDAGGNNIAAVNLSSIDGLVGISTYDPATDSDYHWAFNNSGNIIFPTLTVDLHNGGNQSGQTLQFGDPNQQAFITGPAPAANVNAQRLIIQGQRGSGTGEGGDVYVWGGDSDINGGDIKIYAGDADSGASGRGGNIHISGGTGQNPGGEISLTGGQTYDGPGAPVVVTGGRGSTAGGNIDLRGGYGDLTGGPISLVAGYGADGAGGNVDITGGQSAGGLTYYGNVNINAGASTWHFDNTGNLTVPGNILGSGNILIVPDSASSSAYLDIYLTGGPDIHIASNDNSIVIGRDTGANIFVGNDGEVSIRTDNGATAQVWNFDDTGNLTLPGNIIAINYANGNRVTGNVTFRDEIVIGTGTSNLVSGLYLAPSSSSADANMYLRVRGNINDEPTHIHFDTGNNQYYNQFIGDDNKYIQLANTGNIVINSNDAVGNSAQWTFGTDGVATLPGEGVLQSIGDSVTLRSLNTTTGNANSVYLGTSGGLGFNDTAIGGNWLEIFRNGTEPEIRVPVGLGNLNIQTAQGETPYNWVFDNTGKLTMPGPAQLAVYANVTVRDSSITGPTPGMMIYVTGTGMQVRGATSWNTIAGSGT